MTGVEILWLLSILGGSGWGIGKLLQGHSLGMKELGLKEKGLELEEKRMRGAAKATKEAAKEKRAMSKETFERARKARKEERAFQAAERKEDRELAADQAKAQMVMALMNNLFQNIGDPSLRPPPPVNPNRPIYSMLRS